MSKRRLIDVDKALKDINSIDTIRICMGKMDYDDYCEEVVNILQNAPVVEERKHGHWKYSNSIDGCIPYCSECLNVPKSSSISDYCPDCGAIMDGDSGNENEKYVEAFKRCYQNLLSDFGLESEVEKK